MIRPIMLALVALVAAACGPRAEAVTADAVGRAANVAGDVIASAEREEGLRAIKRADDREGAEASLDDVRARYAPIWATYEVLRAAHEAWVDAIVAGEPTTARLRAAALAAWCALVAAAEERGLDVGACTP